MPLPPEFWDDPPAPPTAPPEPSAPPAGAGAGTGDALESVYEEGARQIMALEDAHVMSVLHELYGPGSSVTVSHELPKGMRPPRPPRNIAPTKGR